MAKIIIKAMKDGPCVVTVDGQKIAALCRCGASNNKHDVMALMQRLDSKQTNPKLKPDYDVFLF